MIIFLLSINYPYLFFLEVLMKRIFYLPLLIISSLVAFSLESTHGKESQFGLNILNDSNVSLDGYKLELYVGDGDQPLYTQTIDVSNIAPHKEAFVPLCDLKEQIKLPTNQNEGTYISLLDSHGKLIAEYYYILHVEHLNKFPVLQVKLNASKKIASIDSKQDLASLAIVQAPQA
jgi:hypothetical protein